MTLHSRHHPIKNGFGVIELVIAIVILGMVYLFTLQGLTLISSMRAFVLAQQIGQYRAAVQQYQADYRALPGDDAGAMGRWPPRPQSLYTVGRAVLSLADDGKINGPLDDRGNPLGEQYMAWRDLRFAGLVGGDTELVGQSARPETLSDITYGFAEDNLGLQQVLCLTRVPGADAARLDRRLDDGVINSGQLRGTSKWDPVEAQNRFEKPDDVPYDPDKTYIICLPYLP
jgi:type II secretory pathway pseudopilin PulG